MLSPASNLIAAFPSDLKLSNRMQVLEFFKTGGRHSANQVAEAIGLSRQTVMKALLFFLGKGLIVSAGKADSTVAGGKRAELYALSGERYLLSVALWPDHLSMTLLNFRREVVERLPMADHLPASADRLVADIGRAAGELLCRHGIARGALRGVCLSTSGIVDYHGEKLKFNSLAPSWGRSIPIVRMLRPFFAKGTAILIENVAKVVGRSILREEGLEDKRVMTVFSSWGGVCSCFMENKHILSGKNSLIGEIGHMTTAPLDEEICGCGSRGCFEMQVSPKRLRRLAGEMLKDAPDSLLAAMPRSALTIKALFEASRRGDACARRLVARFAGHFALALRNVSLVFDPDLVVLQGEYAEADAHFCAVFDEALRDFGYYPGGAPFALRLDRRPIAELDVEGAHTLLLDQLFGDAKLYE